MKFLIRCMSAADAHCYNKAVSSEFMRGIHLGVFLGRVKTKERQSHFRTAPVTDYFLLERGSYPYWSATPYPTDRSVHSRGLMLTTTLGIASASRFFDRLSASRTYRRCYVR